MDDFRWLGAVQLAELVGRRQVSAREVLDEAIARIERLDPAYASVVIPLSDRARRAAATPSPPATAPFAGVPTLLKDAGEELAGTPMWCGTRSLRAAGHISSTTTRLAARLEALGFAIVGKSACPELSSSSTTEPPGFAPTRNPWAPDRSAGGSSGGAAAAVAAGLVPLAQGSDGSGSLRFPASHCGVVTLKPSRGRIGTIPATGQPDPLGLWTQFALARDVTDLRALYAHLADAPALDTRPPPMRVVGLVRDDPIIGLPVDADCARAVDAVGTVLQSLGHRVDVDHPSTLGTLFGPFWDAQPTITGWLRAAQVAWMEARLGRPCEPGDLSDEVLEAARAGRRLPDPKVRAALRQAQAAMAPVTRWWEDGHDLLVTPVTLQPAWPLGAPAAIRTGLFAAPFSFTGQPALVVPAVRTADGRPVGVQLVGRAGDDEALLALGAQLQDAFGWLTHHPAEDPRRLRCAR